MESHQPRLLMDEFDDHCHQPVSLSPGEIGVVVEGLLSGSEQHLKVDE
jgi:hypothetical protein